MGVRMIKRICLIPLHQPWPFAGSHYVADDVLNFTNDQRLISQFVDMTSEGFFKPRIVTNPLPAGFKVELYIDQMVETTRTDSQGNELRFAYVRDLRELLLAPDTPARNIAISAYINRLDDETPIIIYPW